MKNYQHKELAAGRWKTLSFAEQMAHVGSEVERALNWRLKNNADYSKRAAERSLELLDLTVTAVTRSSRLRELTRLREAIRDYFFGENEYRSSDEAWRNYFNPFASAVRKNH